MGTHLYMCDEGGPMVLGVEGMPPQWITCPVCVKALECARCDGAQLQGDAPPFTEGSSVAYRCEGGHGRTIRLPSGVAPPESVHCPDCGGMLMLVTAAAVPAP
jgi:hypothetical protein